MKKLIILLFSIAIFLPHGYSGTIDPSISDQKYIEYAEKFHCIVKINGTYNDDSLFCASAVLIDDNHILTAAHVVDNCKNCFVTIKENKFHINNIVINKDFEKEFGKGDIALGYSEKSFGLDYYPPLYDTEDEINKICSISGYGLTGTFITGAIKADNKKRAGSNIIDSIYKDMLICTPSKHNAKTFTQLEFCIASGDSGGGLFIDGKLAGINSCVMVTGRSPNSSYGEESGHTRVSKFIGWINENKTKMDESSTRK